MSMDIKNLAIIAHVDHGKTTLVDALFKQSGLFRENQTIETCAMDSNELERERGITILAKCTSFNWKGTKLNIVDTPGHADFGGEVERILSMVDGVLVLVDAAEGPMPQTKFVLTKALALNLNPIVVINKIDKSDARVSEVLDEVFELFIALGANDTQLDFPIIYASGRNGWAVKNLENDERKDMTPLLDTIIEHVPNATTEEGSDFKMLVTFWKQRVLSVSICCAAASSSSCFFLFFRLFSGLFTSISSSDSGKKRQKLFGFYQCNRRKAECHPDKDPGINSIFVEQCNPDKPGRQTQHQECPGEMPDRHQHCIFYCGKEVHPEPGKHGKRKLKRCQKEKNNSPYSDAQNHLKP